VLVSALVKVRTLSKVTAMFVSHRDPCLTCAIILGCSEKEVQTERLRTKGISTYDFC
jgi:hypothetical protein